MTQDRLLACPIHEQAGSLFYRSIKMGKGDQRSRRGKIHRGTFGKRRPKPTLHKHAATVEASPGGEAAPAKEKKEPKIVKKQPKE